MQKGMDDHLLKQSTQQYGKRVVFANNLLTVTADTTTELLMSISLWILTMVYKCSLCSSRYVQNILI